MWHTSYITLQDTAQNPYDSIAIDHCRHGSMRMHSHDCFELAYVIRGSAVQLINHTMQTLKKGDYFIIDYDSTHAYTDCKDFELYNCLFLSETIDDTMVGCRSFDKLLRLCLIRHSRHLLEISTANCIFHDDDESVFQILSGMYKEYQKRNIGYLEIMRCRLIEILVITMRKSCGQMNSAHLLSPDCDPLILELILYLEAHYSKKQLIGRFCAEHHYSQQYICRRFKQETGMTALEFLQKIRIRKSCELLAGSHLQIQEIAHQAGYDDLKFFHKVFLRFIHMTPKEYRLHARQSSNLQKM